MFNVYDGGLKLTDWLLIVAATSPVLLIGEIVHAFDRRRTRRHRQPAVG